GCNAEPAAPRPDAGPAFAVTGVYPTVGPHHAGDRLTIVGRGFGDPPDVVVDFSGSTAAILPGGNDREVIVIVPALAPGTYQPVVVGPGGSIAVAPITLESFKTTTPGGMLWVPLSASPPGTIQPGTSFELG